MYSIVAVTVSLVCAGIFGPVILFSCVGIVETSTVACANCCMLQLSGRNGMEQTTTIVLVWGYGGKVVVTCKW